MSELVAITSDSELEEQRIPNEAAHPWIHRLQEAHSDGSQTAVLQQMAPEADEMLASLTTTLGSGNTRCRSASRLVWHWGLQRNRKQTDDGAHVHGPGASLRLRCWAGFSALPASWRIAAVGIFCSSLHDMLSGYHAWQPRHQACFTVDLQPLRCKLAWTASSTSCCGHVTRLAGVPAWLIVCSSHAPTCTGCALTQQ